MTYIRIGTRGSQLALWQANEAARKLQAAGCIATIVRISTTGDKRRDVPLSSIGGKGLFVKELEEALDRGQIDMAVHSLKDVPSIVPDRFVLAGFLERADPRDVWIGRDAIAINALPDRAVIGTSSPRRRAQLARLYPHLRFDAIRGNIDTRLGKVRNGSCDGIVLAAAGLHRLGRQSAITSYFSTDELLPSAGQGIVAIETRAGARKIREAVSKINDRASEVAARCERGVLEQFGEQIDCDSAIAVHAAIGDGAITLRAVAAAFDGSEIIRVSRNGTDKETLMREVFDELVAKGAMDLVLAARV